MPGSKRVYNVHITRIHAKDKKLLPRKAKLVKLPSLVDLRSKMPPVYDQGELGSCTANALCAAFQYIVPTFQGSRLFLYYNERKLENDIPDDAGAYLQDGIQCLQTFGLCPESEWPYDISQFAVKPPQQCYIDALNDKAVEVHNINNDMNSMKHCLHSGFPFVVAIAIYPEFESIDVAITGVVSMPSNEESLGGHAVLVCGYNDLTQQWIVRNSWGASWGDKGYFYLPYKYLLDSSLATDLWCITKTNVT